MKVEFRLASQNFPIESKILFLSAGKYGKCVRMGEDGDILVWRYATTLFVSYLGLWR